MVARRRERAEQLTLLAALTVTPRERVRVLLTRFLDHGRCPSCGYRSIIQFQRSSHERAVLSCRTGPCGFHAIVAHFRALLTEFGSMPDLAPDDDAKPFEYELLVILTEVVKRGLCPACGERGALAVTDPKVPSWTCRHCGSRVGAPAFEVWRYFQSREERGLPYRDPREARPPRRFRGDEE